MRFGAILGGIVAFVFLIVMLSTAYTIDEGERGVVLRAGEYKTIANPGFHLKTPFVDTVVPISLRETSEVYNLRFLSQDQQEASVKISVNYSLAPDGVSSVYGTYGSREGAVSTVITPQVSREFGILFGQFSAEDSTKERGRLNTEANERIRDAIQAKEPALIVNSVQVELIDFSEAYKDSIEQRMLAEVAVQTSTQNHLREKVEADIVEERARGEANSLRMLGEAEADAIAARAKALSDNPRLVELVQAERWNGVLPTTMIPSNTVPVINPR